MEALKATIEKNEDLAQYEPFIKKTLAVRILQKAKNFYRNLKFKTLAKLLSFYGEGKSEEETWASVETLLYECNREGLVKTVIDHRSASISFNKQVEVIENLISFGNKLRKAFIQTRQVSYQGHADERNRIFMKVKEKIDEETARMGKIRADIEATKEIVAKEQEEEKSRQAA